MIDGAFLLKRLHSFQPDLKPADLHGFTAADLSIAEQQGKNIARLIQDYTVKHCWQKTGKKDDEDQSIWENVDLYRIFFYDCPPLEKRMHFPISGGNINFAETPAAKFRKMLHNELRRKRKFALRLGHLMEDSVFWRLKGNFKERVQREIVNAVRTNTACQLSDESFELDIKQKGVDMRLGIDIASLAYKKLVSQIILIAGDSDFVPAAKLARREGIDVIVDSLGLHIRESLLEHIDGHWSHWHSLRPPEPAA